MPDAKRNGQQKMTWLTNPAVFLWPVIVLFALSAGRYAWDLDWPNAGYSACAAMLNVFVVMGGK